MKTKMKLLLLTLAMVLAMTVGSVSAAIEVTSDHVVSGTVTGTLMAIDTPYYADPHIADVGWELVSGNFGDNDVGSSRGAWEPDGTEVSAWYAGFV